MHTTLYFAALPACCSPHVLVLPLAHLHCSIGHVLGHGGAVQLRAIGIQPISCRRKVQVGRDGVQVVLSRHVLGVRVRDVLLNLQTDRDG